MYIQIFPFLFSCLTRDSIVVIVGSLVYHAEKNEGKKRSAKTGREGRVGFRGRVFFSFFFFFLVLVLVLVPLLLFLLVYYCWT